MKRKVVLINYVFLFALITAPIYMNAQTLEDAQKAYNAGVTAKSDGNMQEAISQFNSCISTCEIVFDETEDEKAEELMIQVQSYIPNLYLILGSDQIQAKNFNEGLENLYKAKELAAAYGEKETEDKSLDLIVKVHYKLGAKYFKEEKYDAALIELDKSLSIDLDFVSAYYLKTAVYKQQDNAELVKASALEGINRAKAKNATKTEDKIVKLAGSYFLIKGNEAKTASKNNEAISFFNTALEINPNDVTTLYLLSSTYLALGDNKNAIENGQAALQYEDGGDEAKAKIYMIIAEAQAKNNDTVSACETYQKAAVGQYAELANYRIKHELKCK